MTLYSPGGLNLADTTAPLILAYDDSGTKDVVFAVSSSGDLTITPDGGDVTVSGTLTTTGTITASSGVIIAGSTDAGVGVIRFAGNILILQGGTSGFQVNNAAGDFNNISMTDAGDFTLRGDLEIDGDFNHDGTNFGALNTAPQAQQAHIVDADGNLADITTKFNTLLADLEGFGFLAAA